LRSSFDVRVPPGEEPSAERELRELGAEVEVRPHGELRVKPGGPLRPLLGLERPLAIYVVRPLPERSSSGWRRKTARRPPSSWPRSISTLSYKGKMTTFRVTVGREVEGDRKAVGRLAGSLGRRLGLIPRRRSRRS
jgi:hypothetical protein